MRCSSAILGIAALAVACGRDLIITTGTEGGRCYGNGTCNEDLFCSGSGLCVRREPGNTACTGAACTGSIDGMVLIDTFPGGAFYIDAYEASFMPGGESGFHDQDVDNDGKIADAAAAAAHAASHGLVYDDDGGEESVTLTTRVAQSVSFVLPAIDVSFYQAMAACANAGKRLCTPAEWLWACRGPNAYDFPYGDDYDGGDDPGVDCWTNHLIESTAQATGTASACVTSTGVFDMSGNVWELTDYIDPGDVEARGGDWQHAGPGNTCGAFVSEWDGSMAGNSYRNYVGFRCCRPM